MLIPTIQVCKIYLQPTQCYHFQITLHYVMSNEIPYKSLIPFYAHSSIPSSIYSDICIHKHVWVYVIKCIIVIVTLRKLSSVRTIRQGCCLYIYAMLVSCCPKKFRNSFSISSKQRLTANPLPLTTNFFTSCLKLFCLLIYREMIANELSTPSSSKASHSVSTEEKTSWMH